MLTLEALGVSGAPAPGRLTTTFRLAEGVLLDAGGTVNTIPGQEWSRIAHVLLSHAHLDHTLSIPFLLTAATPVIYGLQETLDAVRENLLDGRIWPNLRDRATWVELECGDTVDVDGLSVAVGPADHTVPCASFSADGVVVIGDTRRHEAVLAWAAAQQPRACVVECSYPDAYAEMANRFGHQTPRDLPAWREALGDACEICLTHVKPKHEVAVRAECEALGDPRLRILHDGDTV